MNALLFPSLSWLSPVLPFADRVVVAVLGSGDGGGPDEYDEDGARLDEEECGHVTDDDCDCPPRGEP